jgi:hypothetical protein
MSVEFPLELTSPIQSVSVEPVKDSCQALQLSYGLRLPLVGNIGVPVAHRPVLLERIRKKNEISTAQGTDKSLIAAVVQESGIS